MKQTNDFNCGPAAIIYFLKLHGVVCPLSIEGVMDAVRCEPERGTDPRWIREFVSGFFEVEAHFDSKKLVAPSIVLYLSESRDEESGHYGVVTKIGEHNVIIFDPWADCEYEMKLIHFIPDWHCRWYGDRWMLTAK
jgi:predicted double-glycine peptidase